MSDQRSQLVLGTAAFGGHDRSRYGLNAQRPPTRGECVEMLEFAERHGLTFDTAAAYGVAEELVGSCVSPMVPVTTKLLPLLSAHPAHLPRLMAGEVMASRERLRRDSTAPFGIMFHSPHYGADPAMVKALCEARQHGLCSNTGTSVYYPAELDAFVDGQDLVQLPYSVFDRRFATCGAIDRARARGIKVYARSPFCQGLVVLRPEAIPERLAHARPFIQTFWQLCEDFGMAPAEAALRFALDGPADAVVFGVDSISQLEQNLTVATSAAPILWQAMRNALSEALQQLPDAVVVPSLWANA